MVVTTALLPEVMILTGPRICDCDDAVIAVIPRHVLPLPRHQYISRVNMLNS